MCILIIYSIVGQEVQRFKTRIVNDCNNIIRGSSCSGCWCRTSLSTNIKMHVVSRTPRGHAFRSVSQRTASQILFPMQPREHKETGRWIRGEFSFLFIPRCIRIELFDNRNKHFLLTLIFFFFRFIAQVAKSVHWRTAKCHGRSCKARQPLSWATIPPVLGLK